MNKKISTAIFVFLLMLFLFTKLFVIRVDGLSMYPTLENNQLLLVNRISYDINKKDIVLIDLDGDKIIKRVVATEGDIVKVSNNQVFINDELYETNTKNYPDVTYTIESGEYFVLGDNEKVSYDSRAFGPITEEQIIGEKIGS